MASAAPDTREGGPSRPASRAVRYVSALKIPVALFCIFGVGLASYYFLYVRQQTRYVTGRNFRVLSTVGGQLEASVASAQTVIQSFLNDSDVFSSSNGLFTEDACAQPQEAFKNIAGEVPLLRSIQIEGPICHKPGESLTPLLVFVESSQVNWRVRETTFAAAGKLINVKLNLADVLQTLMEGETIRDLFVSLVLTTSSGRVIAQTGDPHLRVADLGQLPLRTEGNSAKQTFTSISGSPNVAEVELAGSDYTLFIQPCCGNVIPSPDKAGIASGWVLNALVPKGEMQRAGMAFPPSVVLALSIALLLAVLAWPFLKLVLIGAHERVRIHDVLLVGVCGLLGLSLLTLGAVDLYAYQKLLGTLDGQLKALASEVEQQARAEADSANRQLEKLEARSLLLTDKKANRLQGLASRLDEKDATGLLSEYPFFSSFALIKDGRQYRKWTIEPFVTPLAWVADRDYVTYWHVKRPGSRFFVDSIRSKTTGGTEAMLSRPFGAEDSGVVSALTIPLRTLLDPVLVPGFGFAVFDDSGRVLFHSDSEHNLSESIFAETDGSRRLRALVTARRAEWLDLRYWGEDHRAFLKPVSMEGLHWSLITFYDKPLIRTVNMEVIISSTFYTLLYCGLFVCGAVGLVMFRPLYRIPWLWPDAAHAGNYLRLLFSYAAMTGAFVIAITGFSPDKLIVTSWLLPLLTWSLAAFVLRPDRGAPARLTPSAVLSLLLAPALLFLAERSWAGVAFAVLLIAGWVWALYLAWRTPRQSMRLAPPLNLSYGLGTAGFVLVTVILPAVGFFSVAHAIHTQTLIKYGELELARDLGDREERDAATDRQQFGSGAGGIRTAWRKNHQDLGFYHDFFFHTSLPPSTGAECRDDLSSTSNVLVPAFLEELLPYYSESSVKLRELVHSGATDDSWRWFLKDDQLRLCLNGGMVLTSTLLPLFGHGLPANWGLTCLLFAEALLMAATAAFIIRFIMRRIFVVELIDPLWSGKPVRAAAIQPTLVVLGLHGVGDRFVQPADYHIVDLQRSGAGDDARRRWFDARIEEIRGTLEQMNVLILRFDHDPTDEVFNEHKLAFVERLVTSEGRMVAVLSAVDPEVMFDRTSATDATGRNWRSHAERWTALKVGAGLQATSQPAPAFPPAERDPRFDWRPAGAGELLWRFNALWFSRQASFLKYERRDPFIESQWNQVLPFAWHADARPPLDLEQLLVEVGERSQNYYQAFWEGCSTEERVVLSQVATDRLVNEKSSQTVRGLMARGLIERRPYFDVMNETFRRFVLTRPSDEAVTELRSQHGPWDSIRWPFLLLVSATAAVFFGTQRELFQQTIGVITAVAATLPTLIKVATMFGGKTSGSGGT